MSEIRFPGELPPCDIDENQVSQVIDNLVVNAQQAMPSGGTITVDTTEIQLAPGDRPDLRPGAYVRVSIADTGVEIPAQDLLRIFDPFFTTKPKGSGLGLATCYSILQRHEGCIDVESVPGQGTTFHLYFPASQEKPPVIRRPIAGSTGAPGPSW